jgi:hypothetical protein
LNDTTRVARLASVTFNPRTDGIVDAFDVERVEAAGDGESELVTIRADVRTVDGGRETRRYRLALARRDGRWIVSGIAPGG